MQNRFTCIALTAFAFSLTGCGTGWNVNACKVATWNQCAEGVTFGQYAETMLPVGTDEARIYVYRNSTWGPALQPKIRVNGEVVGVAQPMSFVVVDTSPGEYVVSVSTEVTRELSFSIEPAGEVYVRLDMKMGWIVAHVTPTLVDQDVARRELEETRQQMAPIRAEPDGESASFQ